MAKTPTKTTAIGFTSHLPIADPKSLFAQQIEVPELRPHDLLVEVEAVSVNPVDVKLRAGARAGAPSEGFRVLGFDGAGVVRAVGESVELFQPGDEVFYAGSIDRPGTNQRLHAVDERIVGRKPTSLSFADAASLPLTAITAWETLFDRLRLHRESTGTLLVVGATGGVGSVLLQLAEALLPGVEVIATASTPDVKPGYASWERSTPSTTTRTSQQAFWRSPPTASTGSSRPTRKARSRSTRRLCGRSATSWPSTTDPVTSARSRPRASPGTGS